MMCEIYWQIVAIHAKVSQRWKRSSFHSFPIKIENFKVTNINQDKSHAREVLDYKFEEIDVRKYDLDNIFLK